MVDRKSNHGGSVFKTVIGQADILVVIHPSLRELSAELPLVIAKEVERLVHNNDFHYREHVVRAEACIFRHPEIPEGPRYFIFVLKFHFCCGNSLGSHSWNREYCAVRGQRGWEVSQIP